jgi:hypothetical protein
VKSIGSRPDRAALALFSVVTLVIAMPAFATDFGMFATSPLSLHPIKTVSADETFTVSVGLKVEPGSSVIAYSLSVEFDADFGNELELVSVPQPPSVAVAGPGITGGPLTPTGTPIGVDSSDTAKGTISSFAGSTTPGSGIVNESGADVDVIDGSITFKARGPIVTDGADAFIGFFVPGDSVTLDSGANHTHITFGDMNANKTIISAPSMGPIG